MFVLFVGTRVKRSLLGAGSFACPFCFATRTYEHVESRTWVHLFWVLTLVPVGGPQESVHCTTCRGEWAPSVLHRPTPA